MTTARHSLDDIGATWLWLWPLPKAPLAELAAWRRAGITGLVPQQSDQATTWVTRWGAQLRAAGFEVVIGLGRISTAAILRALREGHSKGVMIDQEMWKSVADSNAVVRAVLAQEPLAADRIVDCHYPALIKNPETGRPTGHARIAKAWAPLCGLRGPQCYWAAGAGGRRDGAPDGWVAKRLAHARVEYPQAGGSTADRVRASVQLYRRSVADHVSLLLGELATGSVWLWRWQEADPSARVALDVVAALRASGWTGSEAVRAAQEHHDLDVDGIVGPQTCGALGVEVRAGVVWRRP